MQQNIACCLQPAHVYLFGNNVNTFIFFGHLLSFISVTDNRHPCTPLATHQPVTPQMAHHADHGYYHSWAPEPHYWTYPELEDCSRLTTAEYTSARQSRLAQQADN